jgi:hypothetical protein
VLTLVRGTYPQNFTTEADFGDVLIAIKEK